MRYNITRRQQQNHKQSAHINRESLGRKKKIAHKFLWFFHQQRRMKIYPRDRFRFFSFYFSCIVNFEGWNDAVIIATIKIILYHLFPRRSWAQTLPYNSLKNFSFIIFVLVDYYSQKNSMEMWIRVQRSRRKWSATIKLSHSSISALLVWNSVLKLRWAVVFVCK